MSYQVELDEGGVWSFDQPSENGHRGSIVIRDTTSVGVEEVRWVDYGRIALGEITVLAGLGGLGKSLWMCHCFARITRGESDIGEPRSVIILSAEDAWSYTLKPRLIAAGADLDRVKFIDAEDLVIPSDVQQLEAAIEDHADSFAALGLDPLVAFIGDDTDTHRDHDTRRALGPLAAMAGRQDIAIVGIMHLNKKDGSDPYKRLSSSVAFWNAVRSVLVYGEDPENPDGRILASAKMNLAPRPESVRYRFEPTQITEGGVSVETVRLERSGVMTISAQEVIGGNTDGGKTGQAEAFITDLWRQAGRAVSAEDAYEVAKDNGISRRTMRRALHKLGGKPRKQGYQGASFWVPPDGFFPGAGTDVPFEATTERDPLPTKESAKGAIDVPLEGSGEGYDPFGKEDSSLWSLSSSSVPEGSNRPGRGESLESATERSEDLPDPY